MVVPTGTPIFAANPDAHATRDEKVGSIDAPDQGGDAVFEICGDQVIAQRRCLGLQEGLDLAHHAQDVKPGTEGTGKFDSRK
jgi:hypothetical protein